MNLLRKWAFRLLLFVVAVLALLLAADNSSEVPLAFLDYESMALPVSWWILIAFVLGTLFGMVTNLMANTKLRLESRKANKALERSNAELDKARADSLPVEAESS